MKKLFILLLITPFLLNAQQPWEKTNGPFGGTIEGFASKPTGELYTVNSTGLYKSTNNGVSWFLLTGDVLNINTVEIAPSGRIYLGTDLQGVWWSDNEGLTWNNNQITHNPHSGLGASISDIRINPAGHIFVSRFRSVNGGISWFELSVYARDYLFLTGNEIMAATNEGVKKSTDNGTTWFPLNNGMGNIQVNCIKRTSAGIFIAGTNAGGIYISNDNGANWTQSNSGLTNLNVLELGIDAAGRVYASVQGGIFISTDNALSWQQLNLGFEPFWFYDFDIINGTELFASTLRYGIIHSTDNGSTWNTSHNGINVLGTNNIVFKNAEVFLNANGTLYYSTDTGENWELRNNGLSETSIISLDINTEGNLYAGTINSGLLFSSDNGISWLNIIIPNVNRVDKIAIDELNRLTISSSGKLYHSSDSGNSWIEVFNSDTVFFLPDFLAVNNNGSIFFAGFTFFLDDIIFYSTDFGVNWDSVNFGSMHSITSIYSDGENVYLGFDNGTIRYSDNDGGTWQNYSAVSLTSSVSGMNKLNNDIFIAAVNPGGIFYTSDNGATWHSFSSGLPSGSLNFIKADVNNMLYAGKYPDGVYRNNTWHHIVPVEMISFQASTDGKKVSLRWVTSTEANNYGFDIERFSDYNQSEAVWEKIGFVSGNGTTSNQSAYSFFDNDIQSGKYKYRLKQIDFDGSFHYSDIIDIVLDVPEKFALYQNYPNPFNPTTNIGFQISELSLVTLKIFDVLGNEVATLVNEKKEPGVYEIKFNASQFSSGTYFYQLKAGKKTETRKFILIQ